MYTTLTANLGVVYAHYKGDCRTACMLISDVLLHSATAEEEQHCINVCERH
jgi:hypothetical protein